jgi:hypothetical protein
MKAALLILGLTLFAFSCTTKELCEEDSISELVASFKTVSEGLVTDTTISGLQVYGIREGQDIWFLYDTVPGSEILLPLDPLHDFSRFVFQTGGQSDTLTLQHHSQEYLISYSCGFGKLFDLDEIQYRGGMFVKDSIINSQISTSLEETETHIWLYF